MASWMSWWGGGSNQKQKQAKVKETVLAMKSHVDMLQKKETHLQQQIDQLEADAKAVVGKNRNEALRILKRKNLKQKEYDQTYAARMAMETQQSALDMANLNQEQYRQTTAINEAMKQIGAGISVEKVDDMMESIREQSAMNDEISQAMAAPAGQLEDEDLEAELEALQEAQLDEAMLNTGSVPVSAKIKDLPSAANGELKGKAVPQESEEEAELRKLQAEMAM
ncbi:hypothetical protein VdG1_08251 [Verticillium dahliae VDG1]|nr:hypothetical protein VdG1_08251 [Verticillium dahliae VDG1]